jgi:hypothetical protein
LNGQLIGVARDSVHTVSDLILESGRMVEIITHLVDAPTPSLS